MMAQIFEGRTLFSTCIVDPGESSTLPSGSLRFDIFFKNGATGWEVARKMDSDANSFTLSKNHTRFIVHEARDNDPIEQGI